MKGAAAAILAVILHTGIACSKIAHAAGPFDGEWKGATARIMHKCEFVGSCGDDRRRKSEHDDHVPYQQG